MNLGPLKIPIGTAVFYGGYHDGFQFKVQLTKDRDAPIHAHFNLAHTPSSSKGKIITAGEPFQVNRKHPEKIPLRWTTYKYVGKDEQDRFVYRVNLQNRRGTTETC